MIKIDIINGIPYVFNAADWRKLRTEHRIIGFLDGAENQNSQNNVTGKLPLKLSNVEAQHLIKNNIAFAVTKPDLKLQIPSISYEEYSEYRSIKHEEQLEMFKEKKKRAIESIVDNIIEGKRKKGKSVIPDKETVIQDELAKIKKLPYEFCQVELKDIGSQTSKEVSIDSLDPFWPSSYIDKLRLKVFEEFHSKGKFYITEGLKFGGDFLAYSGDPLYFHSEFIIICMDKHRIISELKLLAHRRLAQTVNKTLIIANYDETTDSVVYKKYPKIKLRSKNNNNNNTSNNINNNNAIINM